MRTKQTRQKTENEKESACDMKQEDLMNKAKEVPDLDTKKKKKSNGAK